MSNDSYSRLRKFLNQQLKGKFWDALLNSLAEGDNFNEENILWAKKNMFLATSTDRMLERRMAALGIIKPIGTGIDDDTFRELGIKQTNTKLVSNIFLDVYETFYGSDAVRASIKSSASEFYQLYDGMTLHILADNNKKPLTITFLSKDFENIATASASEVAAIITRQAFNAGYTLYAEPEIDFDTGNIHVKISSGTKGPKSSLTIIGGAAQNILQFPATTDALVQIGTGFTPSFVGQYIRFTWTSGPDPKLTYLNIGDYANLYGSNLLESNRGHFRIENISGGPIGESYFEIINPNFQMQPPIIATGVPGVSGSGQVIRNIPILPAFTGLVRSSNILTISTSVNHDLSIGDIITISGAENPSFNGTFAITSVTPTTIEVLQNGPDASSGSGLVQSIFDIEIAPVGASRSVGVSTITTTINHNFIVGQTIEVSDVIDSSFNGEYTITGVTVNTITYDQNYTADIVFFKTQRTTLQSLARYATLYEVNPYEIVAFLPATSNIVKRNLFGSWHINNSVLESQFLGSYIYNSKSGYAISKTETALNDVVGVGQVKRVLFGQDTSQFPDQEGFLVFEYGTSNEEGPVRYLGRPSSGSWLIDPSYKFKKRHEVGASVTQISSLTPYQPKTDGSDYQAYVTGTIQGRVAAIELTNKLAASGINVNIVIVYPQGPGLASVEDVYGEDVL